MRRGLLSKCDLCVARYRKKGGRSLEKVRIYGRSLMTCIWMLIFVSISPALESSIKQVTNPNFPTISRNYHKNLVTTKVYPNICNYQYNESTTTSFSSRSVFLTIFLRTECVCFFLPSEIQYYIRTENLDLSHAQTNGAMLIFSSLEIPIQTTLNLERFESIICNRSTDLHKYETKLWRRPLY